MKLKCDKHGRRLIVGDRLWAHRTGDQSKCDSNTATIGETTVHIGDVEFPKRFRDDKIDLTRVTEA